MRKILVIDDDPLTRHVLEDILVPGDYTVGVAEDGEEGLKKLRTGRYDLVITDVLMPGMDGFRLLREIRKDDALKDIPVIFYTGTYLDREDEALARGLGVSRYLIKPLAPGEIVKAVRDVLRDEEEKKPPPPAPASMEEPVFLKLYNERLVNKLKSTLVESERARIYLAHIMESMGDGMVVIDRDYTVVQANSAAAASLGVEKEEMTGRKCYEIIHRQESPCRDPHVVCPMPAVFERDETVKVLHTHMNSSRDERHIEITASPLKDRSGETFAMVETYRDIMEKKVDDALVNLVQKLNEAQTHLKHMADTDELTGLKNRRSIMERLEEEFQRAKRSHRPLSLIMLDIDHFKLINDAHGHLFGDFVLKMIALRIKDSLRKHDILGRVGGEEFLIVAPDSGAEESVHVAERVRRSISAKPIGDKTAEVGATLSAGVTVMTAQDATADMIFSRADTALYKAKEEGRNRVALL
jgi:diguanylate cyclase (GGDEF)-like protein/PAS domain S-box-containing protein